MINSYYNELKSSIIKNGFNMQKTAEALKISIFSLIRKMRTGKFNVSELQKLIPIIGKDEIDRIFFA